MKFLLFMSISILANQTLQAQFIDWEVLEQTARNEGINTKMLSHVECFFQKYEDQSFERKYNDSQLQNQCKGDKEITLESKRVVALIDYTKNSNEERMYLLDRKTGKISHMAVAHGRYKAGFLNMKLSNNKNTIKRARYFSNELGSNAPSSGFYIAGKEYQGKFGRSLTLHGLEKDINDNACLRSVVIHKHKMMTEKNAFVQSSGCPMVSASMLDHVVDLLRGNQSSYGSLVFVYGPREAAWEPGSCDGSFRYY